MSTPDPVPTEAPAPTAEPCPHQFQGDHATGVGYSCKLCGAAGEFDTNVGAIIPVPAA